MLNSIYHMTLKLFCNRIFTLRKTANNYLLICIVLIRQVVCEFKRIISVRLAP